MRDDGCSLGTVTRRQWLRRMGGGFGALGLAGVLADELKAASSSSSFKTPHRPMTGNPLAPLAGHFPARAKRVIFLFMNGGPSHVDTFDPKPMLSRHDGGPAPEGLAKKTGRKNVAKLMGSPFRFDRHGASGIEVSELYPEVAGCIDDICVVRSMHTDVPNHEPALLMMNSGQIQPTRPSLGSWLTYGLGTENQNLPGFVVLCPGKPVVGPQLWSNSFLPGIYQGTHINNASVDPRTIIRDVNPRLAPDEQRRQLDLLRSMNERHAEARDGDGLLEARIQSLEMAFRMQFEAQEAFDIGRESAATRALYGAGEFADACLIARRLAERGVRITQVYFGNGQPWDDHADILNHRNHARKSDRAIAGLLKDLKARGLLDETLVIWGGEFGRTPTSQGSKGRDHHSLGFSMWLAGGGVKGGHVHGATDELGFAAIENKVHVHDLHATVLHLLGIDHERLTYRYSGRDFRLTDVSGVVVRELLS
jgi:Protein of unknown function (DUF1501)